MNGTDQDVFDHNWRAAVAAAKGTGKSVRALAAAIEDEAIAGLDEEGRHLEDVTRQHVERAEQLAWDCAEALMTGHALLRASAPANHAEDRAPDPAVTGHETSPGNAAEDAAPSFAQEETAAAAARRKARRLPRRSPPPNCGRRPC